MIHKIKCPPLICASVCHYCDFSFPGLPYQQLLMDSSQFMVLVKSSEVQYYNNHFFSLLRIDLPDLVPDLSQFQSSLVRVPYLSRTPMYYLTCALEEGCLSSSARGKPFDHYRYASCLFTQFKLLIVDAIHLRWLTTCDLQEKIR